MAGPWTFLDESSNVHPDKKELKKKIYQKTQNQLIGKYYLQFKKDEEKRREETLSSWSALGWS